MIDVGLLVGFAGIFVATLAGVLGVWMERDRANPPWFAIFFSLLIVFASFIEVGRTVVSSYMDAVAEDTMARVLEELAALSEASDDPELASLVGAELSRANPKILKRVEKKVAAKGGDPTAVRRKAAEGRKPASTRAAKTGGARPAGSTGRSAPTGAGGSPAREARAGDGKAGKTAPVAGKAGKAAPEAVEAVTGATPEALKGKAEKAATDAAEKAAQKAATDATKKASDAATDVVGGKAGKAAGDATGKAGKAATDALGDGKVKPPF